MPGLKQVVGELQWEPRTRLQAPLSVRGSFVHWACLGDRELGIQILPSVSWRRVLDPLLELTLSFAEEIKPLGRGW